MTYRGPGPTYGEVMELRRSAMPTDAIRCQGVDGVPCGFAIPPAEWVAHARTHNPAAYTPGWPCDCRVGRPCDRHG